MYIKMFLSVILICAYQHCISQLSEKEELLFNSGFEGETKIVEGPAEQYESLSGVDHTVPAPNDWSKYCVRGGYPKAGYLQIAYEGGDSSKRKAWLSPDPKNPKNTVLRFTVYEPNVVRPSKPDFTYKTRVQATVSDARPGIKAYYQSVRMYLPSSTMKILAKYPEDIKWYSLLEFWNNEAWGKSPVDPCRLTINLAHKKGADNDFHFRLTCDKYDAIKEDHTGPKKPESFFDSVNENFSVPFDTWITIEYYYQEGTWEATKDRPAGHFYMSVHPEGGKKTILFNERVATMHPEPIEKPNGLSIYHPMKLYTNKHIAAFMKANNTPLEVLWDDLKIYSNKIPDNEILKESLVK